MKHDQTNNRRSNRLVGVDFKLPPSPRMIVLVDENVLVFGTG